MGCHVTPLHPISAGCRLRGGKGRAGGVAASVTTNQRRLGGGTKGVRVTCRPASQSACGGGGAKMADDKVSEEGRG